MNPELFPGLEDNGMAERCSHSEHKELRLVGVFSIRLQLHYEANFVNAFCTFKKDGLLRLTENKVTHLCLVLKHVLIDSKESPEFKKLTNVILILL